MASNVVDLELLFTAITEPAVAGVDRLNQKVEGTGKAGKLAGIGLLGVGAAVAGTAVVLHHAVDAALAFQTSQAQMERAVKNAGISWKSQGSAIEDTIRKQALLKGFQETDLMTSFGKLATATGKSSSAMKLQGQAMDLARARGISLQQATTIMSKVWDGNTTSLSRYGIALPKVTTAQDKLKATTKNATAEQVAAAKAADLVSSRQAALAALQQKFGGSAKTYADTSQGAMDRFGVAVDQLEVALGQALLPAITIVATKGAEWITELESNKTVIKDLHIAMHDAGVAIVAAAHGAEKAWVAARPGLTETFRLIVAGCKLAWPTVKQLGRFIIDLGRVILDTVNLIGDIFHGRWSRVWADFKQLASDAMQATVAYMKMEFGRIPQLLSWLWGQAKQGASAIGRAIYNGITGLLGNLGSALSGLVRSAIDSMISEVNSGLNLIHDHWPNVPGAPGPPFGHNPIPMLAMGTADWRGGPALVGEGTGPEIVDRPTVMNLPAHSRVTPLHRAQLGEASTQITVPVMVYKTDLDENTLSRLIAHHLERVMAAPSMGMIVPAA